MKGKSLFGILLSLVVLGIGLTVFRLATGPSSDEPTSLKLDEEKNPSSPKRLNHRFSDSVESVPSTTENAWQSAARKMAGSELKGEAELKTNLELLSYLMDQGSDDEFLKQTEKLIQLYPEVPEYRAMKADFYFTRQNWTAAEESIRDLLKMNPTNTFARTSLGEVQGILGKYDEGLATYEGVLSSDPGNLDALYGTISLTDLQGQGQRGMDRVAELYKANSENGNLAVVYADILMAQKKYDERFAVLQKAMKSDPKNPHVFRISAQDAYREGDPEEAIRYAEESLKNDQSPETRQQTLDLIIKAASEVGNLDRAEQALEEKRQADPSNPDIQEQLEQIRLAKSQRTR